MAAKPTKPRGPGRRFKPGESGNKKGGSAKVAAEGRITNAIAATGLEVVRSCWSSTVTQRKGWLENNDVTADVEATCAIVDNARKGCVVSWKALMERAYGKPRESIELTGKNGGPVRVAEQTLGEMEAELRELERRRKELDGQ